MDYNTIVKTCDSSMSKAVEHLAGQFKGVRTGRAGPGMVENVQVEYYGSKQALRNVANITVQDAATLVIKPFDASQLKAIAKAIKEANLGFNPIDDGKIVRISMPPMTEENRKKIAGQLKEMAEHCKVVLRNARHEGIKIADASFKDKTGGLTEDDHRALKEEIQTLINKYNKQVDDALKSKTEEVMKV